MPDPNATSRDGPAAPAQLLAFGDESMRRIDAHTVCYFMAAAVLPETHCDDVREAVRPLARRSARRIHWRDEEESAKAQIITTIVTLGVESMVVVGAMIDERKQERARAQVLKRLLYELDARQVTHLTLESRHAERDRHDIRTIGRFRNARLLSRRLGVSHSEAIQEPLLWLADAVAGAAGDQRCGRNDLYEDLRELLEHIDLGSV